MDTTQLLVALFTLLGILVVAGMAIIPSVLDASAAGTWEPIPG